MPKPSEPLYHDMWKLPERWRTFFRAFPQTAATIVGWEFFWWVVRHFTITFH